MKDLHKVVRKELYSFLHNLKALFFALAALAVSLALLSGISLGRSQLTRIDPDETDYSTLREDYRYEKDLFSNYVAYLEGKNTSLSEGERAAIDPALYSYYVQQAQLYGYLLDNNVYWGITVFALSDPLNPLYEEYRENAQQRGSEDYRAVFGVASSATSVYFSLAFALVLAYLVFRGRHALYEEKNELNCPLSSRTLVKGKLLFSFLLMTLINLAFFVLSLLLALPSSFKPLFLIYAFGHWQSIPLAMIALSYFLVNEVLSVFVFSCLNLFPRWQGKKRGLSFGIMLALSLASFLLAFHPGYFSSNDKILFYFFPLANLPNVPYGFYNWRFWIVFAVYALLSAGFLFLSSKRKDENSSEAIPPKKNAPNSSEN